MQRDRALRLFFEPFLEDGDGLVDLAQRAMRERQELPCLLVLRPERDYLAVARRRFFGSLQPAEQDAEVRVRVDVIRIQ